MKTVLAVIGGLFVAIVLLIIGLVVFAGVTVGPLIAEATAYADKAIPAIAAHWERDEVFKRATPEFKATVSPTAVTELFNQMATLGAMTKYDGAKCLVTANVTTETGRSTNAVCDADAKFERGSAHFRLGLRKMESGWGIQGLLLQGMLDPSAPEPGRVAFSLGPIEPARGVKFQFEAPQNLPFFGAGKHARKSP